MSQSPQSNNSYKDLRKYAGLSAQILAALGLSVFIGLKVDKWLNFSTPLLIWLLPLIVWLAMIYKLIRETSKKKNK